MNSNIKKIIKLLNKKQVLPYIKKHYLMLLVNITNQNFLRDYDKELTVLRCNISYNKYGGYCVPLSSNHRPAAQRIIANEIYEPQTIEYITKNCKDGDIIHAGTYFGDFLPALSRGVLKGAKVWAFEPSQENFRCAKITLEINGLKNVVLINAALGSKKDSLLLKISDDKGRSLGGSSQLTKDILIKGEKVEYVKVVTIDETIRSNRKVSVIQLDIEGFENEALIGAMSTIKRCQPIIILESLPNDQLQKGDWFAKNILDMGYKLYHRIYRNMIFING